MTKSIEITEVKCSDKVETKCFNVAEFADATNTVDQKEVGFGVLILLWDSQLLDRGMRVYHLFSTSLATPFAIDFL